MNLKKSLAGLAAGFALVGTLAAPAAMASDIGGSAITTASVSIVDNGVFDVHFCGALALNTATQPTAGTAGYAQGGLSICYTDTKLQRPAFDVTLGSDQLSSGSNHIAASNLIVVWTYNVQQQQWDGAPAVAHRFDVGDIGYFVDDHYVAQNNAGQGWTTNNTLDTNPTVNFGYHGVGTISSTGAMEIGLNIPSGTQAGTYSSQLTLSVVTGTQP
jgi:hypothetical protein